MNTLSALAHNEAFNKVLNLLPRIITAVLVMMIGLLLATLFWLFFTPESPLPVVSMTPSTRLDKAATPENYGKDLANKHLFGEVDKAKKVTPEAPPVTRLNLELFGIVARKGQQSYAIIASGKGAKQEIYTQGQQPQPGVSINRILPKKVILKHGGKLEELLLPEDKVSTGNRAHLPRVVPPPAYTPRVDTGATAEDAANKLPENDLGALRDALANNPDKILEVASITEAKDKDGNLIGFRLSPGKNRKLFRKLGLRPGDVVTQVNGVQLDSPAKGLMIMNELSSAASIAIVVKRGDQEVTIEKAF